MSEHHSRPYTLSYGKDGKNESELCKTDKDSPLARLEEGKEMVLVDKESAKAPRVQQLLALIKDWLNFKLSKEKIVIRDIVDDCYDGQIFHLLMSKFGFTSAIITV